MLHETTHFGQECFKIIGNLADKYLQKDYEGRGKDLGRNVQKSEKQRRVVKFHGGHMLRKGNTGLCIP